MPTKQRQPAAAGAKEGDKRPGRGPGYGVSNRRNKLHANKEITDQ